MQNQTFYPITEKSKTAPLKHLEAAVGRGVGSGVLLLSPEFIEQKVRRDVQKRLEKDARSRLKRTAVKSALQRKRKKEGLGGDT